MGRQHYWQDRAQILRMGKKITRGEVSAATEQAIGAPISCLLANISGREAPETARTYLPENAVLQMSTRDTSGNPVVLKQGDTLEISYASAGGSCSEDGGGVPRGRFKIVGDIRPNRRGAELVSYTIEVRKDTEH